MRLGAAHASPRRKTKMVGPGSASGRQRPYQEDIEVEVQRMKTVLQPMKRGQETVEIDRGGGLKQSGEHPSEMAIPQSKRDTAVRTNIVSDWLATSDPARNNA